MSASPPFKKFLRLRLHIADLCRGALLFKWDRSDNALQIAFFQLDSSLSTLSWTLSGDPEARATATAAALTSGGPRQWEPSEEEEFHSIALRSGQTSTIGGPGDTKSPFFSLHTREGASVHVIAPSWREFEVWYQSLLFLTNVKEEPPTPRFAANRVSLDDSIGPAPAPWNLPSAWPEERRPEAPGERKARVRSAWQAEAGEPVATALDRLLGKMATIETFVQSQQEKISSLEAELERAGMR